MQFQRKTRASTFSAIGKVLIKVVMLFIVLFITVILVDKIDFPSPNKKIQKVLPNEKIKIIK